MIRLSVSLTISILACSTSFVAGKKPLPERLVYKGAAVNNPDMTSWGADKH